MTTKKMVCVYASNNLSDAIFQMGNEYTASRTEDKKVFLTCPIGMQLEVVLNLNPTLTGSWSYESENGTYRFNIVK